MGISTPPRFFIRYFTFFIYAQYDAYIIIRTSILGIAAVATLPRNDSNYIVILSKLAKSPRQVAATRKGSRKDGVSFFSPENAD